MLVALAWDGLGRLVRG